MYIQYLMAPLCLNTCFPYRKSSRDYQNLGHPYVQVYSVPQASSWFIVFSDMLLQRQCPQVLDRLATVRKRLNRSWWSEVQHGNKAHRSCFDKMGWKQLPKIWRAYLLARCTIYCQRKRSRRFRTVASRSKTWGRCRCTTCRKTQQIRTTPVEHYKLEHRDGQDFGNL